MSEIRENVIWQSKDGSWNRGFFAVSDAPATEADELDYDFDKFSWVSTGHWFARRPIERYAKNAEGESFVYDPHILVGSIAYSVWSATRSWNGTNLARLLTTAGSAWDHAYQNELSSLDADKIRTDTSYKCIL